MFVVSGFQKQLDWIQSLLLTACSIRLGGTNAEIRNPMTFLKMRVSDSIFPCTDVQASALRSELFQFFLHRMGLLPRSHESHYPRIPIDWSVDKVCSAALLIGPVDPKRVNFDLTCIRKVKIPTKFHISDTSVIDMPIDGQYFEAIYSACYPRFGVAYSSV